MTDLGHFPDEPRGIVNAHRYRSISENWTYSVQRVKLLRERLAKKVPDGVLTIAIAGSFGRFEASAESDADCIIVLANEADRDLSRGVVEVVAQEMRELGIKDPNPKGVFANPRTFEELLPREAGGEMESASVEMDLLGKRMLMLLESRPLYNDTEYERCISEIFNRYGGYVIADTTKEHLELLNNLISDFRLICVDYQAAFQRENEKWPLRNLKLRHSRIVMYMGLLVLLGESSKYQDERKLEVVRQHLPYTPLERIAAVYSANNDFSFYRVAGLYNTFLARISDPNTRDELNNLEYGDRYSNVLFAALKANSDALQAELTRFILARQGEWSQRFFEYVFF